MTDSPNINSTRSIAPEQQHELLQGAQQRMTAWIGRRQEALETGIDALKRMSACGRSSAPSLRCAMGDPLQGLGFTEERGALIEACLDRLGRRELDLDVVGLAALRIVEPPAVPVVEAGRAQVPDDVQPAQFA